MGRAPIECRGSNIPVREHPRLSTPMAYGTPRRQAAVESAPAGSSKKLAVALGVMSLMAVVAVAAVAFSSASAATNGMTQELAAKPAAKAKAAVPLKYGDTITLMDVYNEYILCSLGGRLRTGGFKGGDDQIKIVSPKGGSGGGKYFMIRYSGVVNARTSVLAADTEFKILGGSGPVMVNDRVSFKSEFGFLTGTPSGIRSTVPYVTATGKYT